MARPLKVFQTHIGFHDLIVAAPSMKAAAEAWGSNPRIFAQGFARVTHDADAVTSALAHPGVVLRRPHGQPGQYKIEPDAPTLPKMSASRKRDVANATRKAAEDKRARAAADKRARAAADKRAKQQARDELTAIEEEEARLRNRRQSLQRKFHLRGV